MATVSISAVVGDNGIIAKAKLAKNIQANSIEAEQDAMDELFQEYENAMAGEGSVGDTTNEIETPTEPEEPKEPYADNTLVKIPKTTDGMTPVKYNSTTGKWEKADTTEEWYNYDSSKKEWANVVLGDATFVTENGVEVLDESKPYSQLVWIPRYAYKITTMYHTASTGAGNIDVVFIGTDNKDKNGTEYTRDTAEEYPTAGTTTGMSDFVVHPAFDYGDTKLEGFWVGKFESSNTNCDLVSDENFDVTSGETEYTGNEVMIVRANVTSWRNISVGDSFSTCLAMNNANNPYGLSSDDTVVDPHMTKNSEWGAMAYLTQSAYGKNAEVWINSNTSYITGMAGSGVDASSEDSTVTNAYNTGNGPQASTTGNVYGVYDMSGGILERVAAYITNGHSNLVDNGGELTASGTPAKYRDVYSSTVNDGTSAQVADYTLVTPENGYYGDAVYETSSSSESPYEDSWFKDYSDFPYSKYPFFVRSGDIDYDKNAGVFCFNGTAGGLAEFHGFRVVVPVLK